MEIAVNYLARRKRKPIYSPDFEATFWASSMAFSKNRFLSETVLGVLADGGGDCEEEAKRCS